MLHIYKNIVSVRPDRFEPDIGKCEKNKNTRPSNGKLVTAQSNSTCKKKKWSEPDPTLPEAGF